MRHVVDKLEVEVTTHDAAVARDLVERIAAMRPRIVEPLLARVCDDLGPAARAVRLDAITLDLGRLPIDRFEEELALRLEPALRATLADAMARVPHDDHGDRPSALRTLAIFARTGSLPWWEDPDDARTITRALLATSRDEPERLTALMAELRDDDVAILRLAAHLDDDVLAAMAAPGDASPIVEVVRGLPGVERALASPGEGERASVTPRLAARAALLFTIGHHPRTVEDAAHHFAEDVDRRIPGAPSRIAALGDMRAPLRDAFADVARASRPLAPAAATEPPTVTEPPTTPEPPASTEPPRPSASASRIDARPSPGSAGPTTRPQASTTSPTHTDAPFEATARRTPSGAARTHVAPRATRTIASPATATEDAHPLAPRDPGGVRALALLDHVYVTGAGAVILWPFLRRFFERAKLLDVTGTAFVDRAATSVAIRAIALLAADDDAPPEFTLGLAKVLVGLAPDDPVDLEPPLAPHVRAEGDVLLHAVLEQAPTLRCTTPDHLRATFLARRGVLTTDHGTWLLQVERREEDVLLDRLPWSWSWVKLPWMPHAMRVVW